MKIIVLGAGVVGVTGAWYLAEAGHEVSVIERREAAGRETSFANGGQISAGHAEPWAKPSVVPKILRWLGREDEPGAGTLTEFWVDDATDGVRLRVVESGLENIPVSERDAYLRDNTQGWEVELGAARDLAERPA